MFEPRYALIAISPLVVPIPNYHGNTVCILDRWSSWVKKYVAFIANYLIMHWYNILPFRWYGFLLYPTELNLPIAFVLLVGLISNPYNIL